MGFILKINCMYSINKYECKKWIKINWNKIYVVVVDLVSFFF